MGEKIFVPPFDQALWNGRVLPDVPCDLGIAGGCGNWNNIIYLKLD